MKNSGLLLAMPIVLLVFIVGCAEKISEEELAQELNTLTEEELSYVLSEDEGNSAGQAYEFSSERFTRLKSLRRNIEPYRVTCSDSDSGSNYQESGFVTLFNYPGGAKKKYDKCWTDGVRLQEYVCENNKYKGDHTFECSNLGENYVCKDNACVDACPRGGYLLEDGSCGECLTDQHCVDSYLVCYEGICAPRCPEGEYRIIPEYAGAAPTCVECLIDEHCIERYGEDYTCYEHSCSVPLPEIDAECLEAIPGHNDAEGNRINIVFVGHHYGNLNEFVSVVEQIVDFDGEGTSYEIPAFEGNLDVGVIYGLLGVEPYKTNKEAVNLWYVDKIYTSMRDDIFCPTNTRFESVCPTTNQYPVNICNYHTQSNSVRSMSMINEEGEFSVPAIGLVNHEVGGHAIGGLRDVAYAWFYGWSGQPNCAGTIGEAQDWWGDQIGDGCGENDVLDCLETCYIDGTCKAGEYQTEVQFVAVEPEDCFEGSEFIEGCSLDLERAESVSGAIRTKHIGFKAMTKSACQASDDNCMYWDSGDIYCYDKNMPREDLCESLTNYETYPAEFPHHRKIVGCKYKPHLYSIMKGPSSPKFGPVNEKEICEQLKDKLGSVSGYCTSVFGIS